jgi:hypothetical protein
MFHTFIADSVASDSICHPPLRPGGSNAWNRRAAHFGAATLPVVSSLTLDSVGVLTAHSNVIVITRHGARLPLKPFPGVRIFSSNLHPKYSTGWVGFV